MDKYTNALYPDKINDFINNEGQLTDQGKEMIGGVGGKKLYRHSIQLDDGRGNRTVYLPLYAYKSEKFTSLEELQDYYLNGGVGILGFVSGDRLFIGRAVVREDPEIGAIVLSVLGITSGSEIELSSYQATIVDDIVVELAQEEEPEPGPVGPGDIDIEGTSLVLGDEEQITGTTLILSPSAVIENHSLII